MEEEKSEKDQATDKLNIITLFDNSSRINDFLKHQNKRSTARNYKIRLREFFVWKNIDPEKYLIDPRKLTREKEQEYKEALEKDVEDFLHYIKHERVIFNKKTQTDEIKPLQQTSLPMSAIKELFIKNRIQLDLTFWENLRENCNGKKVSKPVWMTTQQLRSILQDADIEAKAFFLIQMTSCSRINEIVTLGFDDIELEYECPRIIIKAINSKNGETLRKRISPEAKRYLLDYIKKRNGIIRTRTLRTPTNRRKVYDPNLVFPMSKQNAEEIWKRLIINAKLYKLDPITKRPELGTHTLRKYGCSKLENDDLANFLRGERSQSNKTYFEYSDEQIDKLYAEKVENLFVLQSPENITFKMEQFEDELTALQKENKGLQGTITFMTKREKSYNERLEQLERRHEVRIMEDINYNPDFQKDLHYFELKNLKELTSEQEKEQEEYIKWYNERRRITHADIEADEKIEGKFINEKLKQLEHLKETDPSYKNSEIVYIDDVPYFQSTKKSHSKIDTISDEIKALTDKISVLDILSKFDTKTQLEFIKQASQMKKQGKNAIEFLNEINQNKHNLIYNEPKKIKKEKTQ